MRIVFKGVITDYTANLLKRRLIEPKANIYFFNFVKTSFQRYNAASLSGVPKGNLYIITSRSKTFHQGKEKEINRDSESNGE